MYWCLLMGTTMTLRVWLGSHNSGLTVQRKCRGPVKNISICQCIIHLCSSPFDGCPIYYSPKVKFLYVFNSQDAAENISIDLHAKATTAPHPSISLTGICQLFFKKLLKVHLPLVASLPRSELFL
jgi:hypothetical protein